jgi:Flp pilus assembly protein CpaB
MLKESKVRLQMVIGVILASSVALLIFSYTSSLDSKYKQETVTTFAYFVTREIPEGTSLVEVFNSGYVNRQKVLQASLPASAFQEAAQGSQQLLFAQRKLTVGQILLQDDFTTVQATTSGLIIPEGNVVVSIRLQDVERISPFLRPGNDVAIFGTSDTTKVDYTTTRAIVPRAKILGIGDSRVTSDQGYVPIGDPSILTVAVEAEYAAVLIQASKTIALQIALLPLNTEVPSGIIKQEQVLRTSKP